MDQKRKRILVVDRSEQIRKLLTETLDEAGFDVVEASSGEDALHEITGCPADMIIGDLDLPGLSGVELIHQIRSREGNRFVPIIMLTVEDAVASREQGKAAGISGWLVKPFRPENVLSIVDLISK